MISKYSCYHMRQLAPATSKAIVRSWASLVSQTTLARRGRCLGFMAMTCGILSSGRQRAYIEGNVILSITKLDTVSRSRSSCMWCLQLGTSLVRPAHTLPNPRTRSPIPVLPKIKITTNEQQHKMMQQAHDAWDENEACISILVTCICMRRKDKLLDRTSP